MYAVTFSVEVGSVEDVVKAFGGSAHDEAGSWFCEHEQDFGGDHFAGDDGGFVAEDPVGVKSS